MMMMMRMRMMEEKEKEKMGKQWIELVTLSRICSKRCRICCVCRNHSRIVIYVRGVPIKKKLPSIILGISLCWCRWGS